MGALFGGNISTAQVAVTTAAAALASPSDSNRASGGIVIKSVAANGAIVYIGHVGVTTSNGFPLDPGSSISVPVDDPSKIYAVAASGTQTVAILYI